MTFSVANNLTAKTDLATTVTAGTLEVQNNDTIGLGAITVASGAAAIANADMNGRDVNNSGLISVSAGKWFQVESTTGASNATINSLICFSLQFFFCGQQLEDQRNDSGGDSSHRYLILDWR